MARLRARSSRARHTASHTSLMTDSTFVWGTGFTKVSSEVCGSLRSSSRVTLAPESFVDRRIGRDLDQERHDLVGSASTRNAQHREGLLAMIDVPTDQA